MKAIADKSKYGDNVQGRVARFFAMKDDSGVTYLVEILGGITMFLSSLTLFAAGGGASEIALECENRTAQVPASIITKDAMSIAVVTGIGTLVMGVFAKVPIVLAPGLPFSLSFRRLLCSDPSLDLYAGLAANLIIGCISLVMVCLAKRLKGFVAIPEDFRLGMAAGIAALVCTASLITARIGSLAVVPAAVQTPVQPFQNMTLTQQNDSLRIPILSVFGLIILVVVQIKFKRRLEIAWSMLGVIVLLALISNIIRASIEPGRFGEMISRPGFATGGTSEIGTVPRFEKWVPQKNGFVVFRYILAMSIEKLFNSFATVTAIALLLVVSNLGYNKSVFVQAMNDSEKIAASLLVDAVTNIIVAPFLGTVLVTPYIESVVGIVAGTKTGLGAFVVGILYIALSPVIQEVMWFFPSEAVNPGIIYSTIFAIRSLQYLDYRRPTLFFPGLLAFILIQTSFEIGLSSAVSYVVLFLVWFGCKYWICITPQMIVAFGLSTILIIAKSTVTRSIQGLGIAIALVFGECSLLALLLYHPKSRRFLMNLYGNKETDRYFEDENSSFLQPQQQQQGGGGGGVPHSSPPSAETKKRRTSLNTVTESSKRMAGMMKTTEQNGGGGNNSKRSRFFRLGSTDGGVHDERHSEDGKRRPPRDSQDDDEEDPFGDMHQQRASDGSYSQNPYSSQTTVPLVDVTPEEDEVSHDAIVRMDEPVGDEDEFQQADRATNDDSDCIAGTQNSDTPPLDSFNQNPSNASIILT